MTSEDRKSQESPRHDNTTIRDFIVTRFIVRTEILIHCSTVSHNTADHLSAADILVLGIDLCAGRQKRDFSCGSGFYLTRNLDVALDWVKSSRAKPAILAYQVDSRILDTSRRLNLF